MITFPNAKINIGLDILRKRPDGYHDIATVMVPVNWCDILEIVPAKGNTTTLHVTGRNIACPTDKNLVMKAYNALNSITPLPPLDIHIHKVIPDGAGLGGGSADAAFTLTTINELLQLGLTQSELASVASSIGADCPFFIYNRPMLATGIGTDLTPVELDLSEYTILIAKPPVIVPTKEAYAGVTPEETEIELISRLSKGIDKWQESIFNGFEHSVISSHPEIQAIKQCMMEMGAIYTAMSGSGSSVYGIFNDDNLSHIPDSIKSRAITFIGKVV